MIKINWRNNFGLLNYYLREFRATYEYTEINVAF